MLKKLLCLLVITAILVAYATVIPVGAETVHFYDENDRYLFTCEVEGNELAIDSCDPGLSGNIVIPEKIQGKTVTKIKKQAFSSCFEDGGTITLPATVKTIEDAAFIGCVKLTEIKVDLSNPYFTSVDGVLYNKDKTVLVRCPEGKQGELVIPDSVTKLKKRSFDCCQYLTSIVVPGSVTNLDGFMFSECYAVKTLCFKEGFKSMSELAFEMFLEAETLILPASTTEIYDGFHLDLQKLNKVIYYGTEQQWNTLTGGIPSEITIEYRCAGQHSYDGEADTSCNNCGHTKQIKPELKSKTHTSVELKTVSGYEYSIDCCNWQNSGVFSGLEEGNTYRFYARLKSDALSVGESLVVELEKQNKPTPTPTPSPTPDNDKTPEDKIPENNDTQSELQGTGSENNDTTSSENSSTDSSSTASTVTDSKEESDGEDEQASGDNEDDNNNNTVWIIVAVIVVVAGAAAAVLVFIKLRNQKLKK